MRGGVGLRTTHPSREHPARRRGWWLRTYVTWWMIGGALWLLLDDTVALAELIDGAVAAALGAAAATAAGAGVGHVSRPPAGCIRRAWRPAVALVTELPQLVMVLARALITGRRDPGQLRAVEFRPAGDADERAGRIALATVAGSLAPSSVVIAVDPARGQILVHELTPRTGRRGADPLRLG